MILILTVSPGDHQRHVEAQHEALTIAQAETVEQADAEVEDPEDEEVAQDSLVNTSGPETEQSEEGQPAWGADLVKVSHSHP